MKIAIMQPYFFPYIGYFQAIDAVDKYILYENLNYITEGWMHRNRILIKDTGPSYINAQINSKSSNKKISEIQLNKSPIWKKKLLNTLILNYKSSPHFEEIFSIIENLIMLECDFLFEYNASIIKGVCNFLNIKTAIVSSNPNYLPLENKLLDITNNNYSGFPELLLTRPNKKVARVLKICENEGSKIFINAVGGKNLYNKEEFKKYDIALFFIETKPIVYKQHSSVFYPNLSIIDVLMQNGKKVTKTFLKQYTLT